MKSRTKIKCLLGLVIIFLLGGCENPSPSNPSGDEDSTASTPQLPPTGISFSDLDKGRGEFSGVVTVGRALYEEDISAYVIYAGTESSIKTGSPLATLLTEVDPLQYFIPDDTVFDSGVTHLIVYSANEEGENEFGVSLRLVDVSIDQIRELRDGTVNEGDEVVIEDALVTASDGTSTIWIQDENESVLGGIQVYFGNSSGYSLPSPGMRVALKGTLSEFYGTSQISDITELTLASGSEEQIPTVLLPGDIDDPLSGQYENYESMLVRIENVSVTALNNNDSSDPGVFTVTGGLRIDDEIFADLASLGYGTDDTFTSIVGILGLDYGEAVLWPRDALDLVSP